MQLLQKPFNTCPTPSPSAAPAHHLHVRVGHERMLGTGAAHASSPHLPMLAASLFSWIHLQHPLNPPSLVKRLFSPKKTRGSATPFTCLGCDFLRPAPGLRTTAVTEVGLPVAPSACRAVCLSCCVFPRRTAAQECYRGCLVWICQASLNRPQPDPFPASQFSREFRAFFHVCFLWLEMSF